MARKLTGMRGIDGSLLARFREHIKSKYGKTKDRDGSITVRVINSLIADYLDTHTRETAKSEKTKSMQVIEDILSHIRKYEKEIYKNPARLLELIGEYSGSLELRTLIKYVILLERVGLYDQKAREQIINIAYSTYRMKRKNKTFYDLGLMLQSAPIEARK
jgi:hypothetical protein